MVCQSEMLGSEDAMRGCTLSVTLFGWMVVVKWTNVLQVSPE